MIGKTAGDLIGELAMHFMKEQANKRIIVQTTSEGRSAQSYWYDKIRTRLSDAYEWTAEECKRHYKSQKQP